MKYKAKAAKSPQYFNIHDEGAILRWSNKESTRTLYNMLEALLDNQFWITNSCVFCSYHDENCSFCEYSQNHATSMFSSCGFEYQTLSNEQRRRFTDRKAQAYFLELIT
jgi:hypothetical protein